MVLEDGEYGVSRNAKTGGKVLVEIVTERVVSGGSKRECDASLTRKAMFRE